MRETGLHCAEILLPVTDDMNAWSVVACDQFTGEPEYWKQVERLTKDKLSTFNLILPEIYLNDNAERRIEQINENIKSYLKRGVFKALPQGFVLTVRSTPYVKRRIGLLGKIDLEKYEYAQKSNALIRSTEGTLEERIPPRLKIRKNAPVEFPHVMVLFDDEKREITESLYENKNNLTKLYDFDLNMNGGHIEGYFISDTAPVLERFSDLLNEQRLIEKYGVKDEFVFAVGDGNHSLATAKAHWNSIKDSLTEEQKAVHPARYALAEFVNVYDEGIYFEPIHRFVNCIDKNKFLNGLKDIDCGNVTVFNGERHFAKQGELSLPQGIKNTDEYIARYIAQNGGKVDYIHGQKNLEKIVKENKNSLGILFEKMDKSELFKYVVKNGSLPRKTFSMGEGVEKRYYLEGRRISD